MDKLDVCPLCNFTHDDYLAYMKKRGSGGVTWEHFSPMIYRDRLIDRHIVECRSCGMEVIFPEDSEEDCVASWNKLPRHKTV